MIILPFSTYFRDNEDFNESDIENETNSLFERQRAIDRVLQGEISSDEALQILESHSIDIDEYVDCVESNVQFVIQNGLLPDPE